MSSGGSRPRPSREPPNPPHKKRVIAAPTKRLKNTVACWRASWRASWRSRLASRSASAASRPRSAEAGAAAGAAEAAVEIALEAALEAAVEGAPGWLAGRRARGGPNGNWTSPARPRPNNDPITAKRRASPPGAGVNRTGPATGSTLGSLALPPKGRGARTRSRFALPFRLATGATGPITRSRQGSQAGAGSQNPNGLAPIGSGTGAPGWPGWTLIPTAPAGDPQSH